MRLDEEDVAEERLRVRGQQFKFACESERAVEVAIGRLLAERDALKLACDKLMVVASESGVPETPAPPPCEG